MGKKTIFTVCGVGGHCCGPLSASVVITLLLVIQLWQEVFEKLTLALIPFYTKQGSMFLLTLALCLPVVIRFSLISIYK